MFLQVICWTRHFKEHGINLADTNRHVLRRRDLQSRFTVVHGLCASGAPVKLLEQQFGVLKGHGLMGKVVARDRDGDMPLQSAIYSRANVNMIKLILGYMPEMKKVMLENRNKAGETALESSLDLESPSVFKLLLKECISCEALTHLTCFGKPTEQSCTLLHQCIRDRRIAHLRVFLEVYTENANKEKSKEKGLCIADEKGHTAWHYLVRYSNKDLPLVQEVLAILSEYEIKIPSLVVNDTSKETMLHMAYRYNNKALKELLENTCGSVKDRFKRRPSQRNRILFEQQEVMVQPLPRQQGLDRVPPPPQNRAVPPPQNRVPIPPQNKVPPSHQNKVPPPPQNGVLPPPPPQNTVPPSPQNGVPPPPQNRAPRPPRPPPQNRVPPPPKNRAPQPPWPPPQNRVPPPPKNRAPPQIRAPRPPWPPPQNRILPPPQNNSSDDSDSSMVRNA